MLRARLARALVAALLPALAAVPVRPCVAGAWAPGSADASSWNSAAFECIDRGDFPARAGLAVQGAMAPGFDRSAVTVVATPLAFVRAARTGFGVADPGPADAAWLRRVAARFTVGGPLQYVSRRHLRNAMRLTNHTTSELEVRLAGPDGQGPRGSAPLSLTAALTADNLATGYGLDRYGGSLVAERGGRLGLVASAGFRALEHYHSLQRRSEEARLGAGATLAGAGAGLGLDVGCLLRNLRRGDIWQGSARLDVPVRDGVRLSLSGRASSRPEVRGDTRLRGVIGLSRAIG